MKSCSFCTILLLMFQAGHATCQEKTKDESVELLKSLEKYSGVCHLTLTQDGVRTRVVSGQGNQSRLEFFQSEVVQDQLEMTKSQSVAYGKIVDMWKSKEEKLLRSLHDSQSKPELAAINEELANVAMQFENELRDILIAHQLKRVRQIQARAFVLRLGPSAAFCKTPLGRYLELKPGQIEKILTSTSAFQNSLIEKHTKRRCDAIDDWIACLSVDQKKMFKTRWNHLYEPNGFWTGVLIWQITSEHNNDLAKSRNDIEFKALQELPNLVVDVDGAIKVIGRPDSSPITNKELLYSLMRLYRSSHFSSSMKLNEDQIERAKWLFEDYLARMRDKRDELLEVYGENINLEGRNELQKSGLRAAKNVYEQIRAGLSKEQETQFREYINSTYFTFLGPKHDMLDGPLGESMNLSSDQKDKLRNGAKALAEALGKLNLEIENEIYDHYWDMLDEAQVQKAKDLFGESSHKGVCVGWLISTMGVVSSSNGR